MSLQCLTTPDGRYEITRCPLDPDGMFATPVRQIFQQTIQSAPLTFLHRFDRLTLVIEQNPSLSTPLITQTITSNLNRCFAPAKPG
jgi:hypothetical protein